MPKMPVFVDNVTILPGTDSTICLTVLNRSTVSKLKSSKLKTGLLSDKNRLKISVNEVFPELFRPTMIVVLGSNVSFTSFKSLKFLTDTSVIFIERTPSHVI
jgi:hypothetical protein